MIRIGIVGAGGMAKKRARVFHEMPETTVAAVCARTVEKARPLCGETRATATDDYDRLLRDVDAVVICVANNVHARYGLEALQHGKHVLVEYPLCTCIEEAHDLRAAREKSGTVLMVGNTIIHEAMFQYLMKHRERLGRLVSASSRVALYSDDIGGVWYMNPEKTGPVFSAFHYHHIEYYRHFLGEVTWVTANDESFPDPGRPGHRSIAGGTLAMGHVGGAMSCIQWYLSASGAGLPRGLWLNGVKGSVTVLSQAKDRSTVIWDDGGEGKTEVYEDEWGIAGSCRDFVQAIEGKLDHRQRLESDLTTLKVGFAAHESSIRNEIVRPG